MGMYTPGVRKYPRTSALLASSAGLGWSSISVELRSHGAGEGSAIIPQHVEICLVVAGNEDGLIRRNGAGFYQEARPRTGAISLSPAGVSKDFAITSPIPETAHLYLPTTLFDRLKDDFKLPVAPAFSISYVACIGDDVIDVLGRSILSEVTVETAAGRMYVETAALTLAARLVQKYCDSGTCAALETSTCGLDNVRLRRVMDFIEANIKNDITLKDLAGIACYSPFHFARKFTSTMGIAPHRYVSQLRLTIATAELAAGKLPLVEIAQNANFSSQGSFARAFHRTTGMTPTEFRRRRAN
jgi:AraC family transcriptional regulator